MATLSSEDIFIAVMGVTGSGKSTFVSMATGTPPPPEFAQLESCTLGVGIASFQHHSGKTVHLIDTPGFNDTHRTDGDILHELAFWLLKCYNHGIKLSGLVYLHSIREDRLQGSALRALNIFKNMVGPENYHGVVLATSMWDKLVNDEDYDHASERQRELVTNPNFWGEMIRRRSQVKALRAGRTSAEEIVNCIVSANKRLSLRIQVQMAEPENRHIHQTDAGKVLYETLYQEKDIMAQKLDALRKQLGTAINSHHTMKARELRRQMQEFSEGLSASDVLIKDFEKPTQELNETFEQRLERELQQVETMLALNNKRREDLEKELKSAESNSNSNSLFVHQPVRKYRSMVILKPQGNAVDSNVPSKQPVKARPDKDIEQKKKELELLKAQRELLYRKKEMSIQAQNLRVAQGSLLIGVVGTVLTGISVIACSIM